MTEVKHTLFNDPSAPSRGVIGISLILGGSLALIDQIMHWGWLAPISVLVCGFVLVYGGWRLRQVGLLIGGWIVLGLGAGIFVAASLPATWTSLQRIGWVFVFAGMGFGMIPVTIGRRAPSWWAWFPMALITATGLCFLARPFSMANFILYPPLSLGVTLAVLGLWKKWIGFVIPGSLLFFSGLGVYTPWVAHFTGNSLTKTGTMLVIFAFGWGIVTVLSRPITNQFVWWPLIPGGVLAVVGWGLYIGGDPNSALAFIGNTGSAVMVILGIYLLLLRRGIRQ